MSRPERSDAKNLIEECLSEHKEIFGSSGQTNKWLLITNRVCMATPIREESEDLLHAELGKFICLWLFLYVNIDDSPAGPSSGASKKRNRKRTSADLGKLIINNNFNI